VTCTRPSCCNHYDGHAGRLYRRPSGNKLMRNFTRRLLHPPARPPAARRKLIKRPNDRRNEPSTNRKRLSQVSVGRGVRQGRSASSSANCRSLIASSDVDIQQPFIHERVLAAERPTISGYLPAGELAMSCDAPDSATGGTQSFNIRYDYNSEIVTPVFTSMNYQSITPEVLPHATPTNRAPLGLNTKRIELHTTVQIISETEYHKPLLIVKSRIL